MHQTTARLFSTIALLLLTGCASLPKNTNINYFLTATDVQFTVVRTVGCTSANHILMASTVTATPIHRADLAAPQSFDLATQKSGFADADVKFDLTEDGRLADFNSVSTGQGGTLLKDLGSLVLTARAISTTFAEVLPKAYPTECKLLRSADDSKPVTITYETTLQNGWKSTDGLWTLEATASGRYYDEQLNGVIGSVNVDIDDDGIRYPIPPVECEWTPTGRGGAPTGESSSTPNEAHKGQACRPQSDTSLVSAIHARQPALVTFTVYSSGGTLTNGDDVDLWTGIVPVAQWGTPYDIPVPAPPKFGTNTVALIFADSGALKSVHYVNQGSAGQILDAADATLTKAQGETATEASEVKAKADLIAQQQRLILCETSPKDCKP